MTVILKRPLQGEGTNKTPEWVNSVKKKKERKKMGGAKNCKQLKCLLSISSEMPKLKIHQTELTLFFHPLTSLFPLNSLFGLCTTVYKKFFCHCLISKKAQNSSSRYISWETFYIYLPESMYKRIFTASHFYNSKN